MNHVSLFNQFLIKEAFVKKDDIKELLEDYFLEYIDESFENSVIRLDGYISEDDIKKIGTNEIFSITSEMSEGCLPVYDYKLNLNKRYNTSSLQNTIRRIKTDKDFNIIYYKSTNTEALIDDEITGETNIIIRFVYMANEKAGVPEIVKEISGPLKEMGYGNNVERFGISYNWYKSISKDMEISLDWYSKNKINGFYGVRKLNLPLVHSLAEKEFGDIIRDEWNKLKNIMPDLSNLRVDTNKDYFLYRSSCPKIGIDFLVDLTLDDRLTPSLIELMGKTNFKLRIFIRYYSNT